MLVAAGTLRSPMTGADSDVIRITLDAATFCCTHLKAAIWSMQA
jgi:hypothetical protein